MISHASPLNPTVVRSSRQLRSNILLAMFVVLVSCASLLKLIALSLDTELNTQSHFTVAETTEKSNKKLTRRNIFW